MYWLVVYSVGFGERGPAWSSTLRLSLSLSNYSPVLSSQSKEQTFLSLRSDSPSPRRSPLTVADTQRSLQHVANQLPTHVNIEALRNAFGRADRTRRGTLSELQVRKKFSREKRPLRYQWFADYSDCCTLSSHKAFLSSIFIYRTWTMNALFIKNLWNGLSADSRHLWRSPSHQQRHGGSPSSARPLARRVTVQVRLRSQCSALKVRAFSLLSLMMRDA